MEMKTRDQWINEMFKILDLHNCPDDFTDGMRLDAIRLVTIEIMGVLDGLVKAGVLEKSTKKIQVTTP